MSAIWYEIWVAEFLDERWSQWFEGMEIFPRFKHGSRTGTILLGSLPDQAALFGILSQVRNLNLTLIECRRIGKPYNAENDKGIQIIGLKISI
jgi:hypothetical protein